MIKKLLHAIIVLTLTLSSLPMGAETIDGRFYPIISTQTESKKLITNFYGNFNHKIKTVFSDIDGTIIPFNKTGPKGQVPESAKIAAEKLRNANIPLILATGRSSWEGREIAKRMDNPNTYIIGQQGAEILNPEGKLIYQDGIKNIDAKKMIYKINEFNKTQNQDSKIFVYTGGKLYMTEKYSLPYLIEEITVIKSFNELNDFSPVKIGICDTNPLKLKKIQTYLKKEFPNYHIDISADCYCDISSKTATKGNGIKKLAKILNIDLKYTATFGDAENDISMLTLIRKNHGAAIAVENAMPKLKKAANFITLSATDGGFAKGIDEILRNNERLK